MVVISGLFGLAIGSFLNVVAYRLPRGESLSHPPSHCPTCGTPLARRDNIPLLSWVALGGRCRTCRTPISPRYPLVEGATGAAFAALAWAYGPSAPLLPLLVVAGTSIGAVAIDLDGLPAPAPLGLGAGLGAVGLALCALLSGHPGRLTWAAVGAAAGGLAVVAAGIGPRVRDRLGGAGVAAALGWSSGFAWEAGGLAYAAAVVLGAAVVLASRRPAPSGRLLLLGPALAGFGLVVAGGARGASW